MRTYRSSGGIWKKRFILGAIGLSTALIGVVVAQTLPGTACIGNPFEMYGLLFSGSAPSGSIAGDAWAQGATFRGVLDEDGLPALDAQGHSFRAARLVDPNWGNQGDGYDPTLFGGGNKNSDLIGLGQSPWDWGGGGGSPQKNDITNSYFHTRVDPLTGDRWVFVAAETRSINGDSHVDFEFNQAGVVATGTTSGQLVGLGPDGGRTINDFLISIDFVQGGTHPVATIRTWDGTQFVIVPESDDIFSAANLTDIAHGAGGDWKHFSGDGAEVNILTHLQFVEGAANLTALGIMVDPCSTDATFTAKTRSSSSWTADLKDFALVHFPLELSPDLEITAPENVCNAGGFDASVVDHTGLPKTTFLWTVDGCGQITTDPTATSVHVEADPVCNCTMRLTVTARGGDCRQQSEASVEIQVGDDASPALSQRPADQIVECDAVPRAATATATDNCADVSVVLDEQTQPGSCIGDSTILRTWTAVDDCENETTHLQTVTVQDTTAPSLSGVPQNTAASCDAIPDPPTVHAADNCSDAVVQMTEVITAGSCIGEETIERTWIGSDACGNETSRTQTIAVTDSTAPELFGVPSGTRAECSNVPVAAIVTAADNCSDAPVVLKESIVPGACIGDWTLTREWSSSDDCGNRVAATQQIDVEDTTAPTLHGVPLDGVVECSAIPSPPTVTATDLCSNANVVFNEQTVPGSQPGTAVITRTWTATDACGNEASGSQVLQVVDTIDPQLHGVPSDTTAECSAIPVAPQVTATDNCANPAVQFSETTQPGDCDGRWTIVRTWTVRDEAGNETTRTQLIHVADTTPPEFGDLPSDLTAECDAVPEPANVDADDLCSGITIGLRESAEPGDCAAESEITRTWTATDACGNTSTHVQVISVVDTTNPELSGDPQDIVAECSSVPNAANLTATDTCDSNVPVHLAVQTTPGSCIGESTILRTWTAADDCGNADEVTQTVSVHDTTPPTITMAPTSQQVICDSGPGVFNVRSSDRCSSGEFVVRNWTAITANSRDLVTATPQPDGSIRIAATGPAYIFGEFVAEDDCGNQSLPFQFTASARLGREACSQGFWRNHTDRWPPTGFSPSMLFVDAFEISDFSSNEIPASFDHNMTLFEAANMTGGSFNQLLLQGTAALLNAAHPDIDYPLTVNQVRTVMQDAYAGEMSLDEARAIINSGQAVEGECGCPLN